MKNNNKADSTINFARKVPMFLSKHVKVCKPEAVKQFIAQMDRKNGYKHNLWVAYNHCCNIRGKEILCCGAEKTTYVNFSEKCGKKMG